MNPVLGDDPFRYELLDEWGVLPEGWTLAVDVPAVGVDSRDNVYVFNRGPHPMLVFDRDGHFLRSWGEGIFSKPHGLHVGPDDCLYCTDEGDHTVRKCSPEGEVLLVLGIPGGASPYMSGRPFNRCTHRALSQAGDIYVSDGYGNSRIHKFASDGRLVESWGEPGIGPGQFNIAHNIGCDDAGWIYVADRENHRVQVFDPSGRYETQWGNLHRPCGLFVERGSAPTVFVSELGPTMAVNREIPNLGPRIDLLSDGEVISRIESPSRRRSTDYFISPHGIAVDSLGSIYVGEVAYTTWPRVYAERRLPAEGLRTLRKLIRVPTSPMDTAPSTGK
jgi:DNA-binding beta-propeller fold protein YncE